MARKEIYTPDLRLDPLAIAIWYLDDGSLSQPYTSKKNLLIPASIRISSISFTVEENGILRKSLDQILGIKSGRAYWTSKCGYGGKKLDTPKKFYGIRIGGKHVQKFLDQVNDILPPGHGMEYKLRLSYDRVTAQNREKGKSNGIPRYDRSSDTNSG